MADESITGLPGEENVRESIEFEPILKMDLIESQLDTVRAQIENAFGFANFDPTRSLPSGFKDPIGSIQNMGESLLKSSQDIVSSFMAAPDTIAREFGYMSNGMANGGREVSQASMGFFDFGGGYDWQSPYHKSEYNAEATKRRGEAIGEFATDSFGTVAGMATGAMIGAYAGTAVSPGVGTAIGMGLGYAFDSVLGSGIERERAVQKFGDNFVSLARNESNVGLSGATAEELARGMFDKAESFEGRATDVTIEELQGNISTFAGAGGFKGIHSADEFKTTVTSIIEDTREISKTLGMFQEEVVTLMAELKNKGIANVSESKNLLLGISGQADSMGVSSSALIEQGLSAAQAFSGTRFGSANAFNFGIDAFAETQRLLNNNDDIYGAGISRQGGAAGASQNLVSDLTRMGTKDAMLQFYNQQSGGGYTSDPLQLIAGASNFVSEYGVQGLLAAQGRENEVLGSMGVNEQAQMQTMKAINMMDMVGLRGEDGQYSGDEVAGFMMAQNPGMSRDRAMNVIGTSTADNSGQLYSSTASQLANSMQKDLPSIWGKIGAGAEFVWDAATFKGTRDFVGALAVDAGSFIGDVYTYTEDKIFGTERFTDKYMTDQDKENIKNDLGGTLDDEARDDDKYKDSMDTLRDIQKRSGGLDLKAFDEKEASKATNDFMKKYFYKGTSSDDISKIANGAKTTEELMKGVRAHLAKNNMTDATNLQVSQIIAHDKALNSRIKSFSTFSAYEKALKEVEEGFVSSRGDVERKYLDEFRGMIKGEDGINFLKGSIDLEEGDEGNFNKLQEILLKTNEPGSLNSSVLKGIFEDAGFNEDSSEKYIQGLRTHSGGALDRITHVAQEQSIFKRLKTISGRDEENKNSDYSLMMLTRGLLNNAMSGDGVVSEDNLKDLEKNLEGLTKIDEVVKAADNDNISNVLKNSISLGSFFENRGLPYSELSEKDRLAAEFHAKFISALGESNGKPYLSTKNLTA